MPVDSYHDITPAAGMTAVKPVETHHDIVPAMGLESASSVPAKAYGGAITPIEIGNRDIDNEARRLILWSYATAPMFGRAAGGRTYPVAMTKEADNLDKKHAKLKKMSPQEFLNETDPLHIGKGDRKVIDTFKHDIRGGHHLGPLKIYNNGGQDGRHRANAAKELGIKSVPVIDYRKADGGPVVDQAFKVLSDLSR